MHVPACFWHETCIFLQLGRYNFCKETFMGSINNIFSSIFTQTPFSKGSSSTSTNTGTPPSYGDAFELTITQQTNANSSTSDEVGFAAYSASTSSNMVEMGASGSGSDAQSAFEAMLASLTGSSGSGSNAGSDTTHQSGDSSSGITCIVADLNHLFGILNSQMESGSESIGMAAGELLTPANNTSPTSTSDAASNSSSSGTDMASIEEFITEITTSMENNLTKIVGNTDTSGNCSVSTPKSSNDNAMVGHHHNTSTLQPTASSTVSSTSSAGSIDSGSGSASSGSNSTSA